MHAANVACTRLMRKACGADAMRQAEESSGVLVESQAFLGAGKRGLSGGKCTRFQGAYCGNPGTGRLWGSRPTADRGWCMLRRGYGGTGGTERQKWGLGRPDQRRKQRWDTCPNGGLRSTSTDGCWRGDERSARE
jgi:hypothetical protein